MNPGRLNPPRALSCALATWIVTCCCRTMLLRVKSAWFDELQALRRARVLWLTPLAVAGLTLLLVPVNRSIYADLFDYDPQNFTELWDDYFGTGVNLYTCGFFAGQAVAVIFGSALVLADPRPSSPVRVPKLTVAALGGVLLGMVAFAVASAVAPAQIENHWSLDQLYRSGQPFDPNLLHQPGLWRAILTGLVGFPIWAIIGVGATARFSRTLRGSMAGLVAALVLWLPAGVSFGFGPFARFTRVLRIGVGISVVVAVAAGLAGWIPILELAQFAALPVLLPPLVMTSNFIVVHVVADDPHPWSAIGVTLVASLYAVGINVVGRATWQQNAAPADADQLRPQHR